MIEHGTKVVNTESTYDWKSENWSVPINALVSQLFKVGRISLLIGLAFMGVMMLMGEAAYSLFSRAAYASLIKESLIISGWVALWRPAEIFLHEWWPILAEARLYDRLALMPVTLLGADAPLERAV